ncbi:hypothetical protein [Vibrio mediterranei]|uniref:hypothetical protein n=1 Tax=Vibrio mediterranei TaxID=689 RepID=UPI004067D3A4
MKKLITLFARKSHNNFEFRYKSLKRATRQRMLLLMLQSAEDDEFEALFDELAFDWDNKHPAKNIIDCSRFESKLVAMHGC